ITIITSITTESLGCAPLFAYRKLSISIRHHQMEDGDGATVSDNWSSRRSSINRVVDRRTGSYRVRSEQARNRCASQGLGGRRKTASAEALAHTALLMPQPRRGI